VAGRKKKKGKGGSGWSWRLAGIALCAFFALGLITGLSQAGRMLAHRIEALLRRLPHSGHSELLPAAYHTFFPTEQAAGSFEPSSAASRIRTPLGSIALIERADGFFQIDSAGGVHGPISPADTSDLPVLSGGAVEHASAARLVEYAAQLVRAEAILSVIVSEMRVAPSGEMRLFLDRSHLVITLAPGHLPLQLAQAARVLELWRGHRGFIGTIDMTIPGEAIVRPRAQMTEELRHANDDSGVSHRG